MSILKKMKWNIKGQTGNISTQSRGGGSTMTAVIDGTDTPMTSPPPLPPRYTENRYQTITLNTSQVVLAHYYQKMKMKLNDTFHFLKSCERYFHKPSNSESEMVDVYSSVVLNRHETPIIAHFGIKFKGQCHDNKGDIPKRKISYEEQLQLRLSRMTSIAQSLRALLMKEKANHLNLFWDANASYIKSQNIIDEMSELYEEQFSETFNHLQLQIETLKRERMKKDSAQRECLMVIDKQSQTIIELENEVSKKANQIREIAQMVHKLDDNNQHLVEELGKIKQTACKKEEDMAQSLNSKLTEEILHREHLEVLVEIALGKLRYYETNKSTSWWHNSFPLKYNDPFENVTMKFKGSYMDLCSDAGSKGHYLSDTTLSSGISTELCDTTTDSVDRMVNISGEAKSRSRKYRKKGMIGLRKLLKVNLSSEKLSSLDSSIVSNNNSIKDTEDELDSASLCDILQTDDEKALKVKEKVKWFEKKTKQFDMKQNGGSKVQRTSSMDAKPPRTGIGNIAKDIGKKLKRKQRSRTITIPRFNIEDIRSMNDTHEWD